MRRRPRIEPLERRILLASDWQNPWRPRDVSNDGLIAPLDALLGINRLNSNLSRTLPARAANSTEPYYDTNGDGFHSPIDVLLVINTLNGGLKVTANLKTDSGTAPGANFDRLTNIATIEGNVKGNADVLKVRIDDGVWLDASTQLGAGGNFEITSEVLEQLSSARLADGPRRISVEVGYSRNANAPVDRARVEFVLDRTSPGSRIVGDILVNSQNQIVIPFDEPLTATSIQSSQVKLYDITWGEKAGDLSWSDDGNYPRFPVQPLAVQLSADGYRLIVTIPDVGRSAKYLVELRDVVEDKAGNSFKGQVGDAVWSVKANRLASNVQQLSFGTTYRNLAQFTERVQEYRFDLEIADTLLWAGDVQFGTLSRYEIYAENGDLLRRILPGTEPGDSERPAFIPLIAGAYRLRVVDPPASSGQFRVYRTSRLPDMPTSRASGNTETWPLDAYAVNLVAGERIYLEALQQSEILRTVFDPLGEQVDISPNSQIFEAGMAGRYVFMVNRVGYRNYRSIPNSRTFEGIENPITGTLATPGQVTNLLIPVTSGEIYSMDARLSNGIEMTFDSQSARVARLDEKWLIVSSTGWLKIRLERLATNATATNYDLRFELLSDAPTLPLGVWIDTANRGGFSIYRLPDFSTLKFDGAGPFTIVSSQVFQLSSPNLLSSADLGDNIFVVVPGSANLNPWRAVGPESLERPLVFDAANRIRFASALESLEFTFDGVPGEFISGYSIAPSDSDASNINFPVMQLFDPFGRFMPEFGIESNRNLWQIERPGVHRLVATDRVSYRLGETDLFASRSSTWQNLRANEPLSVPANARQFFVIPNDVETLFLTPSEQSSVGSWRIFNQAGVTLFNSQQFGSGVRDSWIDLPSAPHRYLEVDNRYGTEPLQFRQIVTSTNTQRVDINASILGQLAGRGDRVRIEYSLQRGQRVEWEKFSFSAEAILINPAFETSMPTPDVWLVPDSGVYTLELRNTTDTAQDFELKLIERSVPKLGRGISGLGTTYEGNLTRTTDDGGIISFPFEVEAGTAIAFDWLLSDRFDIGCAIIGPADELLWFESFASDSHLLVLPNAGQYRVELNLQRNDIDSAAYKFILRDLATAPTLEPGQQAVGAPLAPFESRLFRMDLEDATDLEFVSDPESHAIVVPFVLYPGTSVVSNQSNSNVTYSAGPLAIRAVSVVSEEEALAFSTRIHQHRSRLTIDSIHPISLQAGTNLFQFESTAVSQQVAVLASVAGLGYRIFDPTGNEAFPDSSGHFTLTNLGNYRLDVAAPAGMTAQAVTLSVSAIPVLPKPYVIGETVTEQVALQGVRVRYAFTVPTDGFYALRTDGSVFAELRDAQNTLVSLSSISSRRIQYFAAGLYTLQLTALNDASTIAFSIIPITGIRQVAFGSTSGTLNTPATERVFRFTLRPDQPIAVVASSGATVHYMTEEMNAPFVVQDSVLLQADREQNLFIFVTANSLNTEDGLHYDFAISPAATAKNLQLNIDSELSGNLDAWQQLEVSFELEKLQSALFIQTNLNGTQLVTPTGQVHSLVGMGLESVLFNLPVGNYKLRASASSSPATFRISVSTLQTAAVLATPFDGRIITNKLYQFNVPTAARYLFSMLDTTGNSTSEYQVINGLGVRVLFSNGAFIPQGQYWIIASGSGENTLSLNPITVQQSNHAFGELLRVQTNSSTEAIIRFSATTGALLDLPVLSIPSGVGVEFRIIPLSVSAPADRGWTNLDRWKSPRLLELDSIVEFRFSGSGTSTLKLIDLRQVTSLVFGQAINGTLPIDHRRSVWRIPADSVVPYVLNTLRAGQSGLRWCIANSAGTEIATPTEGETLSFGAPGTYYLVLESPTPPTAGISVQIRLSPRIT